MTPTTDVDNIKTQTARNRRTTVRDHALTRLVETNADGEIVKATVLHALYRHQPAVSLEDILELNVLVAAPDPGSLNERVDAVLSEAVAQLDGWAGSASGALAENTSLPATEEY